MSLIYCRIRFFLENNGTELSRLILFFAQAVVHKQAMLSLFSTSVALKFKPTERVGLIQYKLFRLSYNFCNKMSKNDLQVTFECAAKENL